MQFTENITIRPESKGLVIRDVELIPTMCTVDDVLAQCEIAKPMAEFLGKRKLTLKDWWNIKSFAFKTKHYKLCSKIFFYKNKVIGKIKYVGGKIGLYKHLWYPYYGKANDNKIDYFCFKCRNVKHNAK